MVMEMKLQKLLLIMRWFPTFSIIEKSKIQTTLRLKSIKMAPFIEVKLEKKKVNDMVTEFKLTSVEDSTKVNGKMIKGVDKALKFIRMALSIWAVS